MKKNIYLKIVFGLIFLLLPFSEGLALTLSERLAGRILLQIEQNGEAWYVEPIEKERYFLGRPHDAFQVMRELGLGISEADYQRFKDKSPSRLLGRIMLRVEAKGEAYYVDPVTAKFEFLGRPADAFRVMRENGLGITTSNLRQIPLAFSSATLPEIALQARFPGKIVYTVESDQDAASYRGDCEARQGVFKTCGSICAPSAENCAEVCAFTCEKPLLSTNQNNWKTYTNSTLGFNLKHSAELKVTVQSDSSVSFVFIGPTQIIGSELYDGISLTVERQRLGLLESLRAQAEDDVAATMKHATLTKPLSAVTVNGINGYSYEYESLGQYTKILLPKSGRDIFAINYLSPDPESNGYEEIVQGMLNTFRVNK